MSCKHEDFIANVEVNRLEDTGQFMANVRINCSQCDLPFEFLGLDLGLDLGGAKISVDGQEARLAIIPKGQRPNPLQRMAFSVNKFDS